MTKETKTYNNIILQFEYIIIILMEHIPENLCRKRYSSEKNTTNTFSLQQTSRSTSILLVSKQMK